MRVPQLDGGLPSPSSALSIGYCWVDRMQLPQAFRRVRCGGALLRCRRHIADSCEGAAFVVRPQRVPVPSSSWASRVVPQMFAEAFQEYDTQYQLMVRHPLLYAAPDPRAVYLKHKRQPGACVLVRHSDGQYHFGRLRAVRDDGCDVELDSADSMEGVPHAAVQCGLPSTPLMTLAELADVAVLAQWALLLWPLPAQQVWLAIS